MTTTATTHLIAAQAVAYGAQQKPAEFAELLNLATKLDPQTIVEIGVAEGGTLWAWQQIAPIVIGVDNFADYHAITAPTDATIIIGDSHLLATLAALNNRLAGQPVDILFIDGDHSHIGVRHDYNMFAPLVRPGGLIAFHDIASVSRSAEYELGVPDFWAEVRGDNHTEIIDTTPGSGAPWGDEWGGIGVLTT